MLWLTWRQFRATAAVTAAALATLAVVLALTRPGLAEQYATGVAACAGDGDCERFFDRFFDEHHIPFLAVIAVVLVLPALVGIFWGAPLVSRELETGTHLLVWNQSVTRTRWLAVKLGLTGLAAALTGGLAGLLASWWSGPLDRSAAVDFALMQPLVFGARGIVPAAYAVFAFVLGVTAGMLLRRALPAMAVTLAVFAALQLAVPLLVRPHLLPPVRAAFEIGTANVDRLEVALDGESVMIRLAGIPGEPGAWVLSSRLADPSGRTVGDADGSTLTGPGVSGACAPDRRRPGPGEADGCLAALSRLGYRQDATYQPISRFWPFQWIETGVYLALALGLTACCFRWLRRRLS